jgi:hypothetical protein
LGYRPGEVGRMAPCSIVERIGTGSLQRQRP